MDKAIIPEKGKYIVAVSGGVDSVVLLHWLSVLPDIKIIVAHFDHGIRDDSADDELFVRELARRYGYEYVSKRIELGEGASEETARNARYTFLRQMRSQYGVDAIMTAHHEDDVIETIFLNILRGTGWRGLCSLRSSGEIVRPFLGLRKRQLQEFAQQQSLRWREDSTNAQSVYMRNSLRQSLTPFLSEEQRMSIVTLYQKQCVLLEEINKECGKLSTNSRYCMIMWPYSVALEMIRYATPLTRIQAIQAVWLIKTGRAGTEYAIGGGMRLAIKRDTFVVQPLSS